MINAPAVVLPVMPLIYHDGDSITLCNCRIKGATMQLSADYSELVGKRTSGRKIHSQRAIRVANPIYGRCGSSDERSINVAWSVALEFGASLEFIDQPHPEAWLTPLSSQLGQ